MEIFSYHWGLILVGAMTSVQKLDQRNDKSLDRHLLGCVNSELGDYARNSVMLCMRVIWVKFSVFSY